MDSECSDKELTVYLSLAGTLGQMELGHGVLPQAAFAASYLQQSVGSLKVRHLVTANNVLREMKALSSGLRFPSTPSIQSSLPIHLCFSDASHGVSAYGQTGYLSGVFLPGGVSESITSSIGSAKSNPEWNLLL